MSYNNRAHEIELRKTIANLERDKEGLNEVAIACDILAACHPSEYLNALVRNYRRLLTSYEAAGGIFRQFQEEHQELIGEKIPEENFEKTFVKVPGEEDHPELALNGFDIPRDYRDVGDLYDPIANSKELKIPDFLK